MGANIEEKRKQEKIEWQRNKERLERERIARRDARLKREELEKKSIEEFNLSIYREIVETENDLSKAQIEKAKQDFEDLLKNATQEKFTTYLNKHTLYYRQAEYLQKLFNEAKSATIYPSNEPPGKKKYIVYGIHYNQYYNIIGMYYSAFSNVEIAKNVEKLKMSVMDLPNIEIQKLDKLKTIVLTDESYDRWSNKYRPYSGEIKLSNLIDLPKLVNLHIHNSKSDDWSGIANLPHLEEIYIVTSDLRNMMEILPKVKNLKKVYVSPTYYSQKSYSRTKYNNLKKQTKSLKKLLKNHKNKTTVKFEKFQYTNDNKWDNQN